MTTRIRLIIISLLIAIIPMILIGILSFYNSRQLVTSDTLDKLEAIASVQEARVIETLEASKDKVKGILSNSQLSSFYLAYVERQDLENRVALIAILDKAKSEYVDFKEIFILNSSGYSVLATNESLENRDFSDSSFFVGGMSEIGVFTQDLSEDSNELALYISGPLSLEGENTAILVAEYNPDVLSVITKLYTTGLGETGETVLAAKDSQENAVYITSNKFDSHPSAKRIIDKGAVRVAVTQALIKNEDTLTDAYDYRGELVFAATRYIEGYDWGLVTKIDRTEALAGAAVLPKQIQLIGAVTLLLVISLVWGASESIFHFMSRPIKEAIDALRASESRLRKANQQLAVSQRQLQDLNKRLEERVKERTKELEKTVARLNVAQKELREKYNYIENLRVLLERFTITIDVKSVMETVLKAIAALVPHQTISYVIAAGEGLEFLDSVYVWAQGPIGKNYLSKIQSDFYEFAQSLPDTTINKKEIIEQLSKKMNFEFLAGSRDEGEGVGPKESFVSPFITKASEQGKVVGLFHTGSISEASQYTKERIRSINDVVNIAAANLERIHALVSSEKSKISDLVQSMSNGVLMFDINRRVIVVNPMMKKMLELDKEDITLADFAKLFEEAREQSDEEVDAVSVTDAVEMTLVSAKTVRIEKLPFKSKYFEMFVTPVRDYERKISGGAIILHDITHITEVDRMKTEFLSVAAHQLRTPLGAMRWNMEMLLSGDAGEFPEPIREILVQVYESNQRMITLVNDLLNVSKIDQGKVKDEPEMSDVTEIIKAAINEITAEAKRKNVSVDLHVSETGVPSIMIDPKRFREVIQNLLSNAVKYNRKNGKVTMTVEAFNEQIKISIADTGMGIPKKSQGRIFSKFFRAENAIKDETGGSGLGLFVVKSYVEEWGGKIDFESEQGKGSTFILTLPLSPKSNQAQVDGRLSSENKEAADFNRDSNGERSTRDELVRSRSQTYA